MMNKQINFKSMYRTALIALCLMTVGVGEMWGNYAYLDLSGYTAWYNDNAYFQVNFSGNVTKNPVEVNGTGNSGVWRFNIGESTGSCTFQRMQPNTENQWNYYNGSISASQNVAHITGGDAGEMRTSFVINYVHNTNQIYFDNSLANFSGNIYFVIGHDYKPNGTSDTYSIAYPMTRVTGTNLYRVVLSSTWEDANFYGVIGSSSDESTVNGDHKWGSSSLSSKGDKGYTAAYQYVFNIEGGVYLCYTSTSGNNQGLTFAYTGTEYTSLPKFNASQAAKKRDTGTDYSDVSGSWPATLKLKGSYMKNATDTARSTITSTTSEDGDGNKTYGAIRSGEVTHTYESLSSSYHFEGWGTGDSPSNTDASYSYNITGNTTTYAFFSKLYTLTYATKGEDTGSSLSVFSIDGYSGSTTSGSSIPTGHMITLVATPATGYEVEGWYSDASCETAYTSGSGDVTIEDNNTFKLSTINADTAVYCKFQPKTYTITLEDMVPTTAGQGSVSVTYNASTNMTASDEVTKPTKNNYDFGGYWVRDEETKDLVTQLIDADGKWIADKTGYTSHDDSDNPTWVHDYEISLYAKWTEHPYSITLSVYPAGSGSISPDSPTTGKISTESGNIVATPNQGWKFKEWQFTKTDEQNDMWCSTGSSVTSTIKIKAQHDGTLTAVFEPRYYLVGGIWNEASDDPSGGMPGWNNYSKPFKVVTTSPVLDTCKVTLETNTSFYIEVRDKVDGYSYGKSGGTLNDNTTLTFTDKDNKVFVYSNGGTEYTFKITGIDGNGRPQVSVERPHQLHFGTGYAGIDNLSSVTSGTTGGTLAVTTSAGSLSNEDWVTYGTDVTYTPSAATGYTFEGFYTSNTYSSRFTQDNPWVHYNVTSDDNVYAKFTEDSTHVHFANDGHGHVEIGGVTRTDTIVGITTHRKIVGVPDVGYKFSSWDKTSGSDYDIDDLSSDTATLSGNGGGVTSGQTVTANFTYRWALKAESAGWGESEFIIENITTDGSGDVVGYVEIDLAANTDYQFTIKDLQTNDIYKNNNVAVQYMTYSTHENWGFATTYTFNCGITTAGKGTYRFTWNITDKTMTVTYPASYQVNYGASPSVGGNITVVDGDENAVPNGGYVVAGGSVTYTAAAASGYTFVGWCATDAYGDVFTDINPWTNSSVAATSNAYAKFKSTNFVIYRTGDMEYDPRAAYDDVESYAGGTISEAIEYRMKVQALDTWYTLCLPFTVSAVKVWDEDDGPAYYDIVPYYRSSGTFYTGHYIIRTPESTTNFPIANFGNWNDPSSPTGYKPAKNTPYIIQWHDGYFLGKYISFFGATGQDIPTSMTEGAAPSDNTLVNVYGNDAMTIGSVKGAYMLEPDYGAGGAWLRDENPDADRSVLPFECYIRATDHITRKYRVIRRGMTITDTPTGFPSLTDDPTPVTEKVLINGRIYIIRGGRVYSADGQLVK